MQSEIACTDARSYIDNTNTDSSDRLNVQYIFWHTAAFPLDGHALWDVGADEIREWHIERGWSDIGYHFVIRLDGTVEPGRPIDTPGAHVKGVNSISVGICFAGHGDYFKFTPEQNRAGFDLTSELLTKYGLAFDRMVGHHEVNRLIEDGVAPAIDKKGRTNRTTKTCPGKLIDMDEQRRMLERRENLYALTPRPIDVNQPETA